MKVQRWIICSLIVVLLAACAGRGDPDIQAEVDAAVLATETVQTAVQATIQSGVEGTVTAMPTWTPQPTATPSPEMLGKTEEELAASAQEAVTQVNRSIEETSTITSEAVSDGTLTQDEAEMIESYVYMASTYLDEAEAILAAYEDVYGDLASEYIDAIYALESELAALTTSVDTLSATLQEIKTSMEQGQALAEEALQQLEQAAQAASVKAQEVQATFDTYQSELSAKIEGRIQAIQEIQPPEIPADLAATLKVGFDYLDTVKDALLDQTISRQELNKIAGLGASFNAGANNFGGDALKDLGSKVAGPEGITANLAGGRNQLARNDLVNLESGLGKRPGRP